MVIDPRLYEKVSGKRADDAAGLAALAGSKSTGGSPGGDGDDEGGFIGGWLRGRAILSIGASILVLIVVASLFVRPGAFKRWWSGITGGNNAPQSQPAAPTNP